MKSFFKSRTPAEWYSTATDAQLAQAAAKGDKKAFVEIVTRYQAMVCGITFGILGDFAGSEDAGQEAFLTAWKKFNQLENPERLRAWLAQIARNAALGQLRRRRGHELLDDCIDVADPAREPFDAAATNEETALVGQALATLPENYRLPLILFYREGKSVEAVAAALELSEDAVKQRLSRGRDMLREQLSGVVEKVLIKTKPRAAFTIAIAIAIGALAAPTAIAAAAFGASVAAASTSTASSFSTKLLSIMSTSKALIIAGAVTVVVFLPIGYVAGKPAPIRVQTETALTTNIPSVVATNVAATESELLAEWRQLHDKLGRTPEAMPALHKAIADIKDPFRRRAFRSALISEWVQLDGASAFQFFSGKSGDSSQRTQLLREWLELDPAKAVTAMLGADKVWDEPIRGSLTNVAKIFPTRVPDLVSHLPKAESYWDNSVRDAFAIMAASDLPVAREAAEKISGPNREQSLAGVAKKWGETDFNAAIKWARTLPAGDETNEILRTALIGRASVDPASALDNISLVPSGGRNAYFATTTGARVLSEAAKTDFDKTIAWIVAHPGRLDREDMMGIEQNIASRLNIDATSFLNLRKADGSLEALTDAISTATLNEAGNKRAEIWNWLTSQPSDDKSLNRLRDDIINSAAYQDPDLALQWVSDFPKDQRGDAEAAELARSLLNGGNAMHRLDSLLKNAPDRIKEPLLQNAFHFLSAEQMEDPKTWIDRLALLPESEHDTGVRSIARAWAEKVPEESISWAMSLPKMEDRATALQSAVSGFASCDAQAAAGWVSQMQPGLLKDAAAESLVRSIAENYPKEAWAWALSIQSPAERDNAAITAIRAIASRDSAAAEQLIAASKLPDDAKAKLRQGLPRKAGK